MYIFEAANYGVGTPEGNKVAHEELVGAYAQINDTLLRMHSPARLEFFPEPGRRMVQLREVIDATQQILGQGGPGPAYRVSVTYRTMFTTLLRELLRLYEVEHNFNRHRTRQGPE
jgi:hypothetical protein